jgi:hypothetical protein
MASSILGTITNSLQSQIPKLVEKTEPQLEATLIQTIKDLRTNNPEEAKLFFDNWNKLNSAVQTAFSPSGGRRKRTHRKHKSRKH